MTEQRSEGGASDCGGSGATGVIEGLSPSATLVALVLCAAFSVRARGVLTADTWFNVRFGQRVWRGELPRINDDVLVSAGAPWVDLQWLAHALWYGVYAFAGVAGVVIVRAALMGVVLAGPSRGDHRATVRPALAALLAGVVAAPFFAARAQSFAECFLALALWCVERPLTARSRAMMFGLALVWANAHGSAPLLAMVLAWRALSLSLVRGSSRAEIRATLALAAGCALAVFATPYGPHLLSHYRGTLANPLLRKWVEEWSAASLSETPGYFFVAAVAAALLARARPWREDPFSTGLVLAFAALGLWSARHQVWFAVAFARYAPRWMDAALGPDVLAFRVASARWTRPALALGIAALAGGSVWAQRGYARDAFAERAAIVAAASERGESVFVDLAHADRALFVEPRLRNKLPYDVRLELWGARDFALQHALERDRTARGLARWERFDVLWLERPEEYGAVISALARSGRWRALPRPGFGAVLRRTSLPATGAERWTD